MQNSTELFSLLLRASIELRLQEVNTYNQLMAKYPNSRGKYQNRNRGPKGLRRNDRIRAAEVRVIGPEGTNLGVMPPQPTVEEDAAPQRRTPLVPAWLPPLAWAV